MRVTAPRKSGRDLAGLQRLATWQSFVVLEVWGQAGDTGKANALWASAEESSPSWRTLISLSYSGFG